MKLKTAKQLNNLKRESSLLNAVADLIETGRVLIPVQGQCAYVSDSPEGTVESACDMGGLYLALGLIRDFPPGVPVHPDFDDEVQAAAMRHRGNRIYWHNQYWRYIDWRDRPLDRLNGATVHDFVTNRNDAHIPTADTVAELRRMAQVK